MNEWLLRIIRCPLTSQPLEMANPALVDKLLEQSQAGQLFSHKGIAVDAEFDAGLVDQTHTYFYRIRDGIPSLIPDEAVSLSEK